MNRGLMNRKKVKKDNRGAAMIMVIVSIAFIGMLVAMIVYMAYCNYMMKATDRVAKDNFYSAESVLDAINAGLQQDISDSMSEAYVTAMQNSAGQPADEMSKSFHELFFERLKTKIAENAAATPLLWDEDHVIKLATDADKGGFKKASAKGQEGAFIEIIGGANQNKLVQKNTDYITMENLRVVYTDNKGYVSVIETDIRIKVPDLNYAVASSRLSVENYSIIANTALKNGVGPETGSAPKGFTAGNIQTTVTGNVFGGSDGIYLVGQNKLSFVDSTTDLVSKYYLTAGSFNVDNALGSEKGFFTDKSYENYTENINVKTGRLDIDGVTSVKDDLTIEGSRSEIKISGIYRGYGDSLGSADSSSSILVNGSKTQLDFSKLDELMLSGHAYVGARRYDTSSDEKLVEEKTENKTKTEEDKTTDDTKKTEETTMSDDTKKDDNSEEEIHKNTSDVMLGESVSVKANQMIYMVPADCMYNGQNPMSYAEYERLSTDYKEDEKGNPTTELKNPIVNLSPLWEKLGNAYTSGYKTVFRRVSGSVLVYFYLDFGSNERQANDFFKAYYTYDKAGLTNYVKAYIDKLEWNNALNANNNEKLTIAGNAISLETNGELILRSDTILDSDSKMENALTNAETYENTYIALAHTLQPDINQTTSSQQVQSVYENIVDETAMRKIGTKTFTNGDVSAYITTGDCIYKGDNAIKLIIAAGDVYLENSFDGLVIAGGTVYVGSQCNTITYNADGAIKALRAKYMDGTTTMYAYEALGDSGKLTYAETSEIVGNEYVDLGSMIVYQNWKKE